MAAFAPSCTLPAVSARTSGVRLAAGRGESSHSLRARVRVGAAATEPLVGCSADGYVALGLSHCFARDEDEGKLQDAFLIEPVNASSLECMANGASTSFRAVFALKVEEAVGRNRAALPEEFAGASFCEDYEFRLGAAARTWNRPHAQDNLMDIVPLGKLNTSFNFDVSRQRILNMENIVNDDDNIKQDMSIDVYGREKKEEYAEKAEEKADDDVDDILGGDDDDLDDFLDL